jgi:hypothetical protein
MDNEIEKLSNFLCGLEDVEKLQRLLSAIQAKELYPPSEAPFTDAEKSFGTTFVISKLKEWSPSQTSPARLSWYQQSEHT